jgi:phospholipase C
VVVDNAKSHHWYDVSVEVKGVAGFAERFAGRVETGAATMTDPLMGGII